MKDNVHILVVDDEEDTRTATRIMLERQGYKVSCAAGGDEALEYLKSNEVDIIICDIEMPGMNGFDVLEKVKKLYPDIIFAVMTGYRDVHSVREALLKGVDEFIGKPYTAHELNLIVEKLCWRLSFSESPGEDSRADSVPE